MELQPVFIRPHLIKFLFEEFSGNTSKYESTTAKSVRLYPSSSMAKYLYTQINYQKNRGKQDEFLIYLYENKSRKKLTGEVFIIRNKVTEPLMMTEDKINCFNNLLEDIFRISMVFYIDGCLEFAGNITNAIDKFIDKYDLLELDFDTETIRQLYYRSKSRPRIGRIQFQSSNRVYNYK